jgi:hypothetical protein
MLASIQISILNALQASDRVGRNPNDNREKLVIMNQLQVDVSQILRLLKSTMLRQAIVVMRKAQSDDERRLAYERFKYSIEAYSSESEKHSKGSKDVQEILLIDIPRLSEFHSKITSYKENEYVFSQSIQTALVKIQSRLMFAEGYLPLLVKLLTNPYLQVAGDENTLLNSTRPVDWLSLTLRYENDTEAKLSKTGRVMECVETIHHACLQLAQSTDTRLEIDFVDSLKNTLRFVGPVDNIVALHGLLSAFKDVYSPSNLAKTSIEKQLNDLPVFRMLKRMQHFGSLCPRILDETEVTLKAALLNANKLGVEIISEPERMKVRVDPALEIATIVQPKCPVGTLRISNHDEEKCLPSVSADDGLTGIPKGLSTHLMHSIGRVNNSAKL